MNSLFATCDRWMQVSELFCELPAEHEGDHLTTYMGPPPDFAETTITADAEEGA